MFSPKLYLLKATRISEDHPLSALTKQALIIT